MHLTFYRNIYNDFAIFSPCLITFIITVKSFYIIYGQIGLIKSLRSTTPDALLDTKDFGWKLSYIYFIPAGSN